MPFLLKFFYYESIFFSPFENRRLSYFPILYRRIVGAVSTYRLCVGMAKKAYSIADEWR